ncbi:MAG: glycosyltransferase, partial [Brucella intermedia]
KQNDSLLQAWHKSSLSSRKECHLIFVGSEEEGDFGKSIRSFIKNEKVKNVRITGNVSPDLYKKYLNIADMAVQLRTQSRGETSAAVVDCMAHGVPTIVNQNGSMSEIPEKCVVKIPDEYSIDELVSTLERLYSDQNRRLILSKSSRQYVRDELSPSIIAEQYYKSVEHFYSTSAGSVVRCAINALADLDLTLEYSELWHVMARAIAFNIPKRCAKKQLFIDISELVQRDSRSGVQRVVRSILKELMDNPPDGFRIEPVYAFGDSNGYRYARNYTLQMMGCPSELLHDEFISFDRGDIFLGLDLQHCIVRNQSRKLSEMSERGVRIHFIVYDLLPILLEHHFLAEARAAELHHNWLMAIGECADTLICISEAVADELNEWISKNPLARSRPLAIKAFHLGADIESSSPSKGIPADGGKVLAEIKQYTSFLMVGTLEPRKGYAQSLEAFEGLWAQGYDVSLVMVGQQGWMTGALVNKITKHPEFGKRLFWLSGISDEYLEKIYAACDCLIAASDGEGFGLPLIEAAQHKLPIIARDIPVFREIAGNHAFYFSGLTANELRDSIKNWLQMKHENKHPRSHEMPWLTWKQSTQQLLDIILK